jgi:glycosyltransferase involved in cell wall biosynthesis
MSPSVSVLIPTYQQSRFICRALDSLQAQTLTDWEAIILDDGSRDETEQAVLPYLSDLRIQYRRFTENKGLGYVLNEGIARVRASLIAYLPSDDVYYQDHLKSLTTCLETAGGAALAYSGVRYHYNRLATAQVPGFPLQLVQCLHRKTGLSWMQRQELESDDFERLYWGRLRELGAFVGTSDATCEWVDHPMKRHKLMQEPEGGINTFRSYYRVHEPLRFHTSAGHYIDEVSQYRSMRERRDTLPAADSLKILLVGELAYNADRVLALDEQGHKLYGLWMENPYWYNTVGPLPFGHVEDLPRDHWREAIQRVQPDIIYALLNWQAVPFAHEVMMATAGIPFVWHFKEGPFICLEKGTWPQLVDLHQLSDGQIFSSPEMRDWFDTVVPGLSLNKPTHVLDGDLPKRDWFDRPCTALRSASEGEIHTVAPGRPIGLHPPDVAALARNGIHLHFYGEITHGAWRQWIEKTQSLAPGYLHLHPNVHQADWVAEFSQYDAGWLHSFKSENGGEIRRANWDDLNYPARVSTLALSGLPMIQQNNEGAIVATQSLARQLGLGVFFDTMDNLGVQLHDKQRMQAIREQLNQKRDLFTFDYHVPELVTFFRKVIESASGNRSRT